MNRLEAVAAVCLDEHLRCVLAEREGCVEGVQLREGRALNVDCGGQGAAVRERPRRQQSRGESQEERKGKVGA